MATRANRNLHYPRGLFEAGQFGFFDDFTHYVSADLWTTTATDSGTVTVSDAAGGEVALTASDGTVADNDEVYMLTTTELFKFADSKPAVFECRLKYTEANTDDANVAFGFMSAVAANSILDNGGGPAANYSGAVFYKVDGETVWNVESSISTTQTTTATSITAGGGSYHTHTIWVQPETSTEIAVMFNYDGDPVLDSNNRPVKHTVTLGTSTEMAVFVGVKNGDTNNETVTVDYVAAYQLR